VKFLIKYNNTLYIIIILLLYSYQIVDSFIIFFILREYFISVRYILSLQEFIFY